MKRIIILLFFPIISFSQINIGPDKTICLSDTAQLITSLSGPATSCSGISDSLITQVLGGNGSNGCTFNVVNTSGSALDITGISQGGTYVYTNEPMEVWMFPGSITASSIPIGTPPYQGWTLVGTANITTTGGNTLGYIPISGVTIPVGDTYSFRVQATNMSVSYTNGIGVAGVSTWASDPNITITEGYGGSNTDWFAFSPRCFNGAVHYGSGSAWYDIGLGQFIGSGDTLFYSPSQTTDICAVLDCNGTTYYDTMTINVINTAISTTGISLCNGPLVLTAPIGFSSYNWNVGGNSNTLNVTAPGIYSVICTTPNSTNCTSPPITIYQGTIPVNLSTPDSVFICQGDSVVIDGPLGFNQYSWNTGQNTSSITTFNTGNYILTVTDANGCTGVSNTTTIDISPSSIIANSTGLSLCNGPVTASVASGYTLYEWFSLPSSFPLFGANGPTYLINNPGSYYCVVTYPTGCTANSDTLNIVAGTGAFNVTISVSGEDSTLCNPDGVVVLDAGNYTSYLWNTGETSQQIIVDSLGVYSVDVIDASGCQGTSSPSNFEVINHVNTSSITGATSPTQFNTYTYSVLPTTGSTYQWELSQGTVQTGQGTNSVDVIWNGFGNNYISVIETNNNCIGDTISESVFIFVSSIEENNNKEQKLVKIIDVLGKEIDYNTNKPIFYLYQDGRVEKKIVIE